MKIFVSAYACEPGLGSEIGVGWHWVLEMSKYFEVWVLTRESNRKRIEEWCKKVGKVEKVGSGKSPLTPKGGTLELEKLIELGKLGESPLAPKGGTLELKKLIELGKLGKVGEERGIHFVYFDLPKWARFWKKGLRGVRTYYNIWTRLSDPLVKKTMQENDIKVFHHITYGNALWPVSKYGSSQTFIWGPIGGLETIPEEYTKHFEGKSKLIEKLRRLAVKRAVKSKSLRKRAEKASLILCKTHETLDSLPLKDKSKAILFTDVAAEVGGAPLNLPEGETLGVGGLKLEEAPRPPKGENLELGELGKVERVGMVCVGRLDAWRGFDLAVLATAEALKVKKDINFHLKIVGKGDDLTRLQNLVREKGLENHVTFTGEVSKTDYRKLMMESDIVLNPSLKEGAVTVSFDAMAMGKPLIALDTGGFTRYFNSDYAIVIPKGKRDKTIQDIADAMVRLSDPELREGMSEAAIAAAEKFTWEEKGKEIAGLFEQWESY